LKILEIKKWKPFTLQFPQTKLGNAEIRKTKYNRGFYLMEGVAGYELFHLKNPATITILTINKKQVMVDDPLHYVGMSLLAKTSKGKVLTAGLGLGLYTVFLQSNKNVEDITIIERNKNVIKLIKPLIKKFIKKPTKIINDTIFKYTSNDYDTVMLDLWAGKGSKQIFYEMMDAYTYFSYYVPYANVYIWGLRDPFINPAVKKVSEEYLRFVAELRKSSQSASCKDVGEE
jgi:hypothetical protein